MKTLKNILFIALAVPTLVFGQLSETFSDGNFTTNPTWVGETGNFIVASGKLQLKDPADITNTSYLAMPTGVSLPDTAEWRVDVNLKFDPSGSNYGEVFLMADISDLKGSVNGYLVRIGGASGAIDDVSLYKVTNGTKVQIINGIDGTAASSPDLTIKVVRVGGVFELFLDATKKGVFVSQGTVTDNTFNTNNFAGVYCNYTKSNNSSFYFDNFFIGTKYVAPPAPPAPETKSGEIIATPQIFDPINGDPNATKITYTVDTVGLKNITANLFIFNSRGQMINHLIQNKELTSEPTGSFSWDGKNQSSQNVPIGIYTLVLEYIDDKGGHDKLKAAVAIGTKIQ